MTTTIPGGYRVLTPEQAAADLTHAQRRVHALVDDLIKEVGRDRVAALDDAICDLEGAYVGLVTARLMATIVAGHKADYTVYVAPGGGAS